MQTGTVVENSLVWMKLSFDAVFSMVHFRSHLWIGLSPKPCSGVTLGSLVEEVKSRAGEQVGRHMGHQGSGAQFSSLSFCYSLVQRYALNPCAIIDK